MNIVLESERARGTKQALATIDANTSAAGTASTIVDGCACRTQCPPQDHMTTTAMQN
jgi:hypothetical protein